MVGTLFKLTKVNTVPCICAAALSLSGQQVDGWIV